VIVLATIVIVTFWAKLVVNLIGADTVHQIGQAIADILSGAAKGGGV
jgi:hypothetical protein